MNRVHSIQDHKKQRSQKITKNGSSMTTPCLDKAVLGQRGGGGTADRLDDVPCSRSKRGAHQHVGLHQRCTSRVTSH